MSTIGERQTSDMWFEEGAIVEVSPDCMLVGIDVEAGDLGFIKSFTGGSKYPYMVTMYATDTRSESTDAYDELELSQTNRRRDDQPGQK